MTTGYRQAALEALAHYNISATEIELLRHNENLTYRVGNEYLLQIHEPAEGGSAEFFYDGVERFEMDLCLLIFRFSEWDIRCMILLFCLEISAEHWRVGNK